MVVLIDQVKSNEIIDRDGGGAEQKERWEIVKLEPTDQQILCRGKGERAGDIPQTIINAGLDFKKGVKAGDRFKHHSHRGDNWTVGGDENRKEERKERRKEPQTRPKRILRLGGRER